MTAKYPFASKVQPNNMSLTMQNIQSGKETFFFASLPTAKQTSQQKSLLVRCVRHIRPLALKALTRGKRGCSRGQPTRMRIRRVVHWCLLHACDADLVAACLRQSSCERIGIDGIWSHRCAIGLVIFPSEESNTFKLTLI